MRDAGDGSSHVVSASALGEPRDLGHSLCPKGARDYVPELLREGEGKGCCARLFQGPQDIMIHVISCRALRIIDIIDIMCRRGT
jgi:hypothetical protein